MEDDRNYADECGDHGGRNSSGEPCGRAAGWGTPNDTGRCRRHLGTSPDGSSHEGNDWAATHGAYSESFVEDFLTLQEKAMVEQAQEVLETPEGAQANARLMAAIAQIQARRSGDERFLRRYESICDTFSIAPEDVERLEHTGEGGGPIEVTINRERYDGD